MGSPYRFLLRMPEELRDKLRAGAEEGGRSLNSEIVKRLESSFVPAGRQNTSEGGRMKRNHPHVGRIAVAGVLVAIVAALLGVFATSSTHSGAHAIFKKGDPDSVRKDQAGIANEGPGATYAAQQEAERAYPADSVPFVATQNSQATFASLKKLGKGAGSWQSIGPNQAKYPAVLDQFLAGGKEYTASGRVTALAIGGCKKTSKCSLYLGAAGGGVWAADNATDQNGNVHWQFKGGSLPSNAVGSLLVDPSDPTGNTVYVGTGEPNASGDSEAGLGIYKSTDGGNTWALVPGSNLFDDRAVGALALDSSGHLLVGLDSAVRGVSSTGGAIGCPTPTGCAVRGIYRQTGSTFTLLNAAVSRGVNEIAIDPNTPTTIYYASFAEGVWRSLDNGSTWAQIKSALTNPALSTDRAQFALGKLPNGKTRMYVGIGAQGSPAARFYVTDDAAGAAVFTDKTTSQNVDYCEAQCWYDNVVYSPPEDPNVVYLGGSFAYSQVNGPSNGRAVLMSTDGGNTFSDITRDIGNDGWLHPDQHALVTVPGNPLQWIAGDDGGVVRSDGNYVDGSAQCSARGLSGGALTYCQSLLSRIPKQSVPLNKGLSTLQFQSFSANASDPKNLMGGTQDNGTFEFGGSSEVWPQIIYGDGGQSGFNVANSRLRFNTFTGEASDVNFRNGDPTGWVIATGPIESSPEGSQFYPPIIPDPNAATAGSIFQGSQSVWRTQDWAGNQAYLEANCPEFTTSAANPSCGDFVRIGPAGATDLTSGSYGTSRAGGFVSALKRESTNTGTMWAATTTGRVFITDNANAPTASSVLWTRLDDSATNSPGRFVTGIAVDPANPNHAWISYSGYNLNTPGTPGHVFEVTRTGSTATWVDRTYDLADLPATDIARDDLTGDLYVGTDFNVMKLAAGSTTWTVAAANMPQVEVSGLTMLSNARVLYAATHGLGGFELDLGKVK